MPRTASNRAGRDIDASPWDGVAERLRSSGLRWTPQRLTLVDARSGEVKQLTPADTYVYFQILDEQGNRERVHGPARAIGHAPHNFH